MRANFLKEVFIEFEGKASLAVINQMQMQDAIEYTIAKVLEKKPLIYVSLTKNAHEVMQMVSESKKNVFVIDIFSRETTYLNGIEPNIIYINNPANLTSIQIAVEKALKKFPEGIILFDSLGVLSIYNSEKLFEKFIYLFNNKMNLNNNTVLFFVVKNSINENILSSVKQFCDKTYDFSGLYVDSMELAH